MKVDKISRKEISLSEEETTLFQNTLRLLQKIDDEVNNTENDEEIYLENYGIEEVMDEMCDTLNDILSVIKK